MKKLLFLALSFAFTISVAFSQTDRFWAVNDQARAAIDKHKAVARVSYPETYKLFNLNNDAIAKELYGVTARNASKTTTIISLPNADGMMEEFEVFEASNFEPDLQAQFPEIRAFSGKGITDKFATLKLSLSPQGIQTMVFRTDKENEFIEPYSKDHSVYSVYRTQRKKGELPRTCTTEDKEMASRINSQVMAEATGASTGHLRVLRLAQSCNGEYANFFGATSAADVSKVLAAFNATLTRCNGVYEKDLALHLNLIAASTSVIYYSPSSDPYGTQLSGWNQQLQTTLTNVIGNDNYDIGHMFGASGGGGNAGCIGCVCVNPTTLNPLGKGSGITSPADGIPQGDNFDIDYVVHEVGHQIGANHTFSQSLESGTGVNKEVGSGITIMGYAGITSYDVAPHSIDIFHQASIQQIQSNLVNKGCAVTTHIAGTNAPPAISPVSNYTIPISTPFALTGFASDVNGDALTYCWEQNDNATTSGANSPASPSKATGPNWLSFKPTVSGTRLFPKLSTILSGLNVTPPWPGGDAGANIEALSSVTRTLNFRLTVRDNHPYVAGQSVGQTAFTDAVVTVTNTAGPFAVTAPNTPETWNSGNSATVTWSVNNTTLAPVNCASVNILLSTDGGNTFPIVLASGTPNDGSQVITVPSSVSTTCRIKVESVGNIFFDISNTNFSIGTAAACGNPTGLNESAVSETAATVNWTAVSGASSYEVSYKPASSSTWSTATTGSTTSRNLSGLTSNTVYDWRVRAVCAVGPGTYVQDQFTTSGVVVGCPGQYDGNNNGSTNTATVIPINTDIMGTINVKGDNDYYKFDIVAPGSITISLTTLPADYQLALLSSTGAVLQTSGNSGTANESITRNVTTPSTFYARVYPRNNGAMNPSSCYTLRVQGSVARNNPTEVPYVSNKLTVSPNPAGYNVNLNFNSDLSGNAVVSIVNQTGAVVLRNTISVMKGQNTRKLDVGKLTSGMYFIKVQTGDVVQMSKLIIGK